MVPKKNPCLFSEAGVHVLTFAVGLLRARLTDGSKEKTPHQNGKGFPHILCSLVPNANSSCFRLGLDPTMLSADGEAYSRRTINRVVLG